MSEQFASKQKNDESWLIAEQWFMRFIGVSLLLVAIISMIFGVFPDADSLQFVRGINIVTTLLLGAGSLWSLWWSNDMERIRRLVDGFKENGNGRTYAVAVVQFIVGSLFGLELLNANLAMGLMGVIMLINAVFFVWRAQQIKYFSDYV